MITSDVHRGRPLLWVLGLAIFGCGLIPGDPPPAPDPVGILTACAPAGWKAGPYLAGSNMYAVEGPRGHIRLLTPAALALGTRSTPTLTFIGDWWTVTGHDQQQVTFPDGRAATRYRSTTSPRQLTTELEVRSGRWQLYAKEPTTEDAFDSVVRCVEPRLAAAR